MVTVVLDAPAQPPAAQPPSGSRRPSQQAVLIAAAALAVPAGSVLIILGYHHAAFLDEPDNVQFALYWLGFLTAMGSLVLLACARDTGAVARTCGLVGIGLFGMMPRLQRSGPAGSDEYIHLRQAIEAYYGGDVGHPVQLLSISEEFFGLHQVTSAFARLSGMPLWFAGMSVLMLAHIVSVLAVYQLIRNLDVPARGAAVGAVVYTLNPSWVFFNSGYAYESLGLPLLLLCLAAVVGAGRPTTQPAWRSLVVAALCISVLPTIHHLSTIMLFCILTVLIVARLVVWYPRVAAYGLAGRPEPVWPLATAWFMLVASIHLWWSEHYDWLIGYLSPALTEGLAQLGKILDGIGKGGGQRSLFGDSPNPIYEVVSGYLYPFVTLALFLISLRVVWFCRRRVGTAVWAFAAVGAMFFASMPMVLTQGGAEGAHRSWAYSFIGIAVVCGVAWSYGPRLRRPASGPLRRLTELVRARGVRTGLACVVFVVMSIGSATLGVNLSARFPGTANVGDDARSFSKEGVAVAEWMAENAPLDTPFMSDRWVALQAGSYGRMSALRPSEKFPVWDIYMYSEPVSLEVLKMISDSDIRYFVVDSRMATTRPKMGYWFTRNEPGVRGDEPFPQAALDRFNCLPWLRAVYAAGPLTVYEVDSAALLSTRAGSCEGSAP